jgi:hypothetical protein
LLAGCCIVYLNEGGGYCILVGVVGVEFLGVRRNEKGCIWVIQPLDFMDW